MAVIFYLSGTGNSLYAAQQLQQAVPDCRIEKIGDYLQSPYSVEDKIVGIVSPVYCFALPPAVVSFLEKLQAQPEYCFGVVTMGANAGFALKQLQELLGKHKITLNYAQDIAMPDNFFDVPQSMRNRLLQSSAVKLQQTAAAVTDRTTDAARVKDAWLWESFGTALAWKFMDKVLHIAALFADSNCIGCGICAQICPLKNITMQNGRPVFGSACASCLGCLHWCPQNAVHAGRKTVKKGRNYKHPEITIQAMHGGKQ